MYKIYTSIVCILFATTFAQSQSWISSNRISSTVTILELDSKINNDAEVFSFGCFQGTLTSSGGITISSNGGRDYYLIKFLQNGQVDWMHNIGSDLNDGFTGGISIDPAGDIYITGSFQDYLKYTPTDSMESTGNYDIFLAKYISDGSIDWVKNIGSGYNNQTSTALNIDYDGNVIIAGNFIDSLTINNDTTLYSDNPSRDYFYAKFETANGDLQWVRQIRTLSDGVGNIWNIDCSPNSYAFTGSFADTIGFDNDSIFSYNTFSDIHVFKTDYSGDINWIRKLSGNKSEYSYSIIFDDEDNIYVTGYYESDTIIISLSDNEIVTSLNQGSLDIFIVKYLPEGNLDWYKTIGGKGEDKVFDVVFFNNKVYLSGYFADTISWGGIQLSTTGINDIDMLTGAFDKQGNFREANSFKGRNKSTDEARGLFKGGENLYTVMRSNSDLLVLGDSIYTSSGISYNMFLGIIGCFPISIDNVIVNDVNTCYGDSTGSLQILATGGFGSPYQYSIDNGITYQKDISYFSNLPAGDYPVVVIDQKNCAQEGPVVSVGQPDTLRIEVVSTADITNEADGSIVVAATGGTTPYTFTLLPDNLIQGFGTYTFQPGDSGRYVVQVNDAKNCGPVETDSIDIMDFYGVGFEDISGLEVRMFPNPASNMITLEMPLEEAEVTLEIMSLTGQVLISRQVYPSGGVLRETIDVSDLSRGMYMVRVNGRTLRSGIVVN
ncbi:MAG: T9SS type A sorting domain-containing protein [Bacteroidales bacterium]|nr:T9SS type A sorting domain-containing protein [Bacteroidales bacterium]